MSVSLMIFSIGALANLLLAAVVFHSNPKSATHKLFSLMGLLLVLWSVLIFISVSASDYSVLLWSIRGGMAAAVLQGITFFALVHTFPRISMALSYWQIFGLVLLALIGVGVSLSPYVFTSLRIYEGALAQPQAGLGMVLFVPIAGGSLLLGCLTLLWRSWRFTGRDRVQMHYLLLGSIITFGLIVVGILYLVNVRGNNVLVPYAPLMTLPFVVATAYAIVRYRLMDIRFIVLRAIVFSLLTLAFFGIHGILVYFFITYFRPFELSQAQYSFIGVMSTVVAVVGFDYYRILLRKLTDHFLYHSKVDYKSALVDLSQELAATIKIDEVTDIVLATMKDIVRSTKTVIFLQDSVKGDFKRRASEGIKKFTDRISNDNVLLEYMRKHKGPLVKDELELVYEHTISRGRRQEIKSVQNAMTWMDIKVAVPLYVNKELAGIILLGGKLSGEPYLQDDIEFLAAFAPQAAVALDNAKLYAESLEFGEKLKDEVEKATKELATANVQLRDLDKAKSEFLSIASHQLYTPLTALRGYISMLREGDFGKPPEKQEPILEILEKSSNRLIDLIKNLLDISRIESGRLELNLQAADLAYLAKELVRDLLPNAMNKNLQLEFHQPPYELPRVVVDEQRLRQVMLNFIDNAIKYTAEGRVDVYIEQEGDELVFSVKDTGKGITSDEIAKLFNKFSRVGGSARFHTEGTGLGLYVAKQIVKEHRGDIYVESPGNNQGSTFVMRLPTENSPHSLQVGEKATVVIKAAEAIGTSS